MKNIILLVSIFLFCLNTLFSQNTIYNAKVEKWRDCPNLYDPMYLYQGDTIVIDFELLKGKYVKKFLFYKSYLPTSTSGCWHYEEKDLFVNIVKGNFTHKRIIIKEQGVYHFQIAATGNLKISRIPGSDATKNLPTICYHNDTDGFFPGDKVIDKSVDIPKNNRILLLDTTIVVRDCANPNILAYNFSVELACKFTKGDTIVLSYKSENNEDINQISIVNNISDFDLLNASGEMRHKAEDFAIKVNHEGIFSFVFWYNSVSVVANKKPKIFDVKIERIPANESVKGFISKVGYKDIMVEIKYDDGTIRKWPRRVPIKDE